MDLAEITTQALRSLLFVGGMTLLGMAALVVRVWAPLAVREGGAKNTHVALIATSYSLLLLYVLVVTSEALLKDDPFHPRSLLAGLAIVLGLVALNFILRDLRRRREG
jgi:hypothetical protein